MTVDQDPGSTVLRLRPDRPQRLEALLVAAGPHLESVRDVGTAANGDLLVVLPAPAVRLPELLAAPGGLRAGEAVTVLVPLAQALQRMHDAGVAHGGIRAAAIVLDADGSPAWTAPVAPTLLRLVGETRFRERAAEDVAAFRALGSDLLAPSGERLPDGEGPAALAGALFHVARAEPVRFVRPAVPAPSGPPARLLPAIDPQVPATEPGETVLSRVRAQLRTVRPRAWGGLAVVAALLACALALLPGGGAAPAAVPSPSATAIRATPVPPPAAEPPADPASAVLALVAARDRCLDAGSESCLRGVDQAGSPVLDGDLAAVRAGVDAVRVDRTRLRVAAVTSGTALATAGRATVLAIRDRNDWRLRDVVAEPPVDG